MAFALTTILASISAPLSGNYVALGSLHLAAQDNSLAYLLRKLFVSNPPPPRLSEKHVNLVKTGQSIALFNRLLPKLQEAINGRWDDKLEQSIVKEIQEHLGQPIVRDGDEVDEWDYIEHALRRLLPSERYWQIRNALASPYKRSIEQNSPPDSSTPFIISSPQILLQNVTNFTLCKLAVFGAVGDRQIVEFFTYQQGILSKESNVTDISALLPSLAAPADFVSGCDSNFFHVVARKAGGMFHSVFSTASGNQTLLTPPYAVNLFVTDTAAPSVAKSGRGMSIPTVNNATSSYTTTNSTNQLSSRGATIDSSTTVTPEAVSVQDGRVFVFHRPSTSSKLYVTIYNQFGTVDATYIHDLNQTSIGENLVEKIVGVRTPLPSGAPVPIIVSTNNQTAEFLLSYFPTSQTMVSSSQLPNPGIGPSGQRSVADGGNNTLAYTRDIQLANMQYGIAYGTLLADMTTGVTERVLNFTLSSPGNPQIAFLSKTTILIAYKSNGSIDYVTVKTAAPAPSLIEINPINGQIVRISPDVVSVTLISSGGYAVTYFINGTTLDVPSGIPFPVGQVYNFSITKKNNSDTTPPTFLGCNANDQCSSSTLKNPFQTSFDIGDNLILILSIAIPIPAIAIGVVAFTYRYWYAEHKERMRAMQAQHARENVPQRDPNEQRQNWEKALETRRRKDEQQQEAVMTQSV